MRAVAAKAVAEAALAKNNPPDLINVAPERLIETSLKVPGFAMLDEMTVTIRARVNTEICTRVVERMEPPGRQRVQALLTTMGPDGRSMFNRPKKPAQRPTWTCFTTQAKYMDEIGALGDTGTRLDGIAPHQDCRLRDKGSPPQDADPLSRYDPVKQLALLSCLLHTSYAGPRRPDRDAVRAGGGQSEEGRGRAGGDPSAPAHGQRAVDRHLPHGAGTSRPNGPHRARGTASMVPCRNSVLAAPASSALRRANCTMSGLASSP